MTTQDVLDLLNEALKKVTGTTPNRVQQAFRPHRAQEYTTYGGGVVWTTGFNPSPLPTLSSPALEGINSLLSLLNQPEITCDFDFALNPTIFRLKTP